MQRGKPAAHWGHRLATQRHGRSARHAHSRQEWRRGTHQPAGQGARHERLGVAAQEARILGRVGPQVAEQLQGVRAEASSFGGHVGQADAAAGGNDAGSRRSATMQRMTGAEQVGSGRY